MSEPLIPRDATTTTTVPTTTSQHHWSLPTYRPLPQPSQSQSRGPQPPQQSQDDLRQRRRRRKRQKPKSRPSGTSSGSTCHTQIRHDRRRGGPHHGLGRPRGSSPRGRRRGRRSHPQSVLRRAGSTVFLPRMVQRDLPFHQSSNLVQVRNDQRHLLWRLMMIDWFHTLLRLRPSLSVSFLLTLWVLAVVVFAGLYMTVDRHYHEENCGLGPIGDPIAFSSAFAFSLETCTTVGYSLPGDSNAFFESNCHGLQVVIFFQMIWSMMFNAFMFAFFFSLLSKSEFRSTQIIFTDRLLITTSQTSDKTDDDDDDNNNNDGDDDNENENENGQVYCRLQCYDIDSAYPLVESHARIYLLDHQLKMHPLRLSNPNDDMGGMLYPSVPADIVHGIDRYSALCPPECRQDNPLVWPGKEKKNKKGATSSSGSSSGDDNGNFTKEDVGGGIEGKTQQQQQQQQQPYQRRQRRRPQRRQTHHPGVVLRSVDGVTGNRDDYVCPVCGESYGTYSRLKAHVEHSALAESHDNFPPDHPRCHIGYVVPELKPITLDMVRSHLERTLSEIVVVVEAIDPQLSGTFQSLQSYKFEDIVFGKSVEYAKCMFVRNNTFTVDMNKFHLVENYDSDENDNDDDDDSDTSEIGSSDGDNDTAADLAKWKQSLRPASTTSYVSNVDFVDDNSDDDDDDPHALEIGGQALPKTYKTFQGNG